MKCQQQPGVSAENSLQIPGVVVKDGAVGKAGRIRSRYPLNSNYSSTMMGTDKPTYILIPPMPFRYGSSFFLPALPL